MLRWGWAIIKAPQVNGAAQQTGFSCAVSHRYHPPRQTRALLFPRLLFRPRRQEKKGKRAAHWPASCDAFRVQNPSGVFWGSLPHGNISSWKRQCLWCRRHLTNGSVEWVSWSGSQARGGGGLCEKETCLRALPAPRSLHLESFLLCGSAFTQNAVSKAYFHCTIQLSKGSITVFPLRAAFKRWPLHAPGRLGATLEGEGDVASPVATLAKGAALQAWVNV